MADGISEQDLVKGLKGKELQDFVLATPVARAKMLGAMAARLRIQRAGDEKESQAAAKRESLGSGAMGIEKVAAKVEKGNDKVAATINKGNERVASKIDSSRDRIAAEIQLAAEKIKTNANTGNRSIVGNLWDITKLIYKSNESLDDIQDATDKARHEASRSRKQGDAAPVKKKGDDVKFFAGIGGGLGGHPGAHGLASSLLGFAGAEGTLGGLAAKGFSMLFSPMGLAALAAGAAGADFLNWANQNHKDLINHPLDAAAEWGTDVLGKSIKKTTAGKAYTATREAGGSQAHALASGAYAGAEKLTKTAAKAAPGALTKLGTTVGDFFLGDNAVENWLATDPRRKGQKFKTLQEVQKENHDRIWGPTPSPSTAKVTELPSHQLPQGLSKSRMLGSTASTPSADITKLTGTQAAPVSDTGRVDEARARDATVVATEQATLGLQTGGVGAGIGNMNAAVGGETVGAARLGVTAPPAPGTGGAYEVPSHSKKMPKWAGGSGGGAEVGSGRAHLAKGDLAKNQKEAYKSARAEGLTDTAARALVANMSGEDLRNPKSYHWDSSHMARGIVQWDPQRSEAIKRQFGKYPNDMTVGEQTKAAVWEMKTNPTYKKTWDALNNPKATSGEMIHELVHNYERPGDKAKAVSQREGFYRGLPKSMEGDQTQVAANASQAPGGSTGSAGAVGKGGGDTGRAGAGGGTSAAALVSRYAGKSRGESEQCVALAKSAAGVGHTSGWHPGDKLGPNTPVGTPIATFGAGGKYMNTPGQSHAAIFLGMDKGGIRVLDHWKGHAASERVIPYGEKAESAQNFRVIADASGKPRGMATAQGPAPYQATDTAPAAAPSAASPSTTGTAGAVTAGDRTAGAPAAAPGAPRGGKQTELASRLAHAVKIAGDTKGLKEGPNTALLTKFFGGKANPDEQSWCSDWTQSVMAHAGIKGAGSIATNWAKWGSGVEAKDVKPGDVGVKLHGAGIGKQGGHTEIVKTGPHLNKAGQMVVDVDSGNVGGGNRVGNWGKRIAGEETGRNVEREAPVSDYTSFRRASEKDMMKEVPHGAKEDALMADVRGAKRSPLTPKEIDWDSQRDAAPTPATAQRPAEAIAAAKTPTAPPTRTNTNTEGGHLGTAMGGHGDPTSSAGMNPFAHWLPFFQQAINDSTGAKANFGVHTRPPPGPIGSYGQ